jgi:AraC family transcriptional regulator
LTTKLEAHRGGLSRLRLNRVLEYINANLSEKLELGVLAEVADLNLYHFARAFKQSTGESPHQYVLRRRIEQAKEFLRRPEASVIEASARMGFVDQSHFSKVFRRIVGVAPSEYRANA